MEIFVDFGASAGKMKPMHSVNNGPVYKFAADQRVSNLDAFREAGIPMARTHDASFCATYGGEHTVDIHAIFPDFDADENAPGSYDFRLTDDYLRAIALSGAQVFYRLGSKIEHWPKKYGTLPPRDNHKWAVICEHVIRHYNEGWADGFHMGIRYWEIWNEPDLDPDDSDHKRCWGGTAAEFYRFFAEAHRHLKTCFPDLMIGGPAVCSPYNDKWQDAFFDALTLPLDFFSWHIYARTPEEIEKAARHMRRRLDGKGMTGTQSILNEWNYVRGWEGEDWLYTLRQEKGRKGAAFIAAVMCDCQYAPLDHLMYYDARPCAMNGLFNTDRVCEKLKGYYPFEMFNRLYHLGQANPVRCEEGLYACAASAPDGEKAIFLCRYSEDDGAKGGRAAVHITGCEVKNGLTAQYRMVDETHDGDIVREERLNGGDCTLYVDLNLFDFCLISLKPC